MRAASGPRLGRVVAFDEAAGYGEVEDADGDRVGFHCTAIADGTRTVAVGAAVRFVLVPGHLGRWEAGSVTVTG
ncbi:MAG: cold shock domain-containing protein [Acidimicrobiales bacterium]|jgi:cold shock CspA family protein|nr:cold shock domain-containing protein [Acidimicrobiales bacterium]